MSDHLDQQRFLPSLATRRQKLICFEMEKYGGLEAATLGAGLPRGMMEGIVVSQHWTGLKAIKVMHVILFKI